MKELTSEQLIQLTQSDFAYWKKKYSKDGTKYAQAKMNDAKRKLWALGIRNLPS